MKEEKKCNEIKQIIDNAINYTTFVDNITLIGENFTTEITYDKKNIFGVILNEKITDDEIQEKEFELTKKEVKPLMEKDGIWKKPNLDHYNNKTREDFTSNMKKGELVKGVTDFSIYVRFFNQKREK